MRNGTLSRSNKPCKFSAKRSQFVSSYKITPEGGELTERCVEMSEYSGLNPASKYTALSKINS
jgi:hypothetical protein